MILFLAEAGVDPPELQMMPPEKANKIFSKQYARLVIQCVECRKPRLVYSWRRLGTRQELALILAMSEYDYTCGAPILPPDNQLVKLCITKPNLTCAMTVQIPYYSSGIGRLDICCHCGIEEAHINEALKKSYKTVLPICDQCELEGKTAVTQYPYGKKGLRRK